MHSNDGIIRLQLGYVIIPAAAPTWSSDLGTMHSPSQIEEGVGRENVIIFVTSPHTLLGAGVECEVCQGGAGGPWPGSGVQEGTGG